MSFEAFLWATSPAPQSTGAARALLCILANFANKDDGHTCFPSDETLAQTLHCGVRTVWRYIDDLKIAGDIAVQKGGGRSKRNIYSFPALSGAGNPANSGRVSEQETLPNQRETLPNRDENPANSSAKPCQTVHENPATVGNPIKHPFLTSSSKHPEKQPTSSSAPETAQALYQPDDEEEDVFAFASDLSRIVGNRDLLPSERAILAEHGATTAGRRRIVSALSRLSARWPDIGKKHDCTVWLSTTLGNLQREDERKEQADAAFEAQLGTTHRRNKYTRHESEAPLDELRLEHAIEPEPWTPPPPPGPVDVSDGAWDKVKAELQLQLASSTFYTWLHNTTAVEWDDERIVIATPNTYARDWLENRLEGVIKRTVRSIHGKQREVVFEVAP